MSDRPDEVEDEQAEVTDRGVPEVVAPPAEEEGIDELLRLQDAEPASD